MTRLSIKSNLGYLEKFVANKKYSPANNGLATTGHNLAEFVSVWQEDPKVFDPITARGYLTSLCEEMRWEKKRIKWFLVERVKEK